MRSIRRLSDLLTIDFELFKIEDGDRVLDAGCGDGRHIWEVCRIGDCYGCGLDLSEPSLKKAKSILDYNKREKNSRGRGDVMLGDVLNLPFRDGAFDKIICSEVMEHVIDDERGAQELVRILKDGGSMVVTVPTYVSETIYWTISKDYWGFPGGHIRKYKVGRLVRLLERQGLKVYAIRYKHSFHTIYWLLRCIFGVKNENALIPSIYHRFLVRQIETRGRFPNMVEGMLDFIFPKSLVLYTRKVEGKTK